MHDANLRDTAALWGLTFEATLPGMPIQGSPERCLDRVVIRTDAGPFLLEELSRESVPRKSVLARRLTHLAGAGLAVAAPVSGRDGRLVQSRNGKFWQLSPYVPGIELDRDTYWREAWRGEAMALYLADMHRAARGMNLDEPPFDMAAYARRIEADTRRLHPRIHDRLVQAFATLHRGLAECGHLPVVFSHGDPHPLNVIWGEDRILAAIDWEFCGPKCALYDMALVLGCVGSEGEGALDGPLAQAFLRTLRSEGLLGKEMEAHLPTWILALRTAWLAEWLRRGDTEAAEFEVFYMELLSGRVFARERTDQPSASLI